MPDHRFIISITHKSEGAFDVACKADDEAWSISTEIQLDLSDINSIDADKLACIFSEEVKYHWRKLRDRIWPEREKGEYLKFFLHLDERKPLLHNLPWEQISDPYSSEGTRIANYHWVSFIRAPLREPQRIAGAHNRASLKALVVIVRPENLKAAGYDDIDTSKYQAMISDNLQDITATQLVSQASHPITIDALRDKLLSDSYDIVYIVCHGQLSGEGEAVLILQNQEGNVQRVNGTILAQAIDAKDKLPSLIFLISCQSGGADRAHQYPHRALGYRLSKIGVDAVVAYHGTLYDQTAQDFARGFFEELRQSRWVDFAVTRGRQSIKTSDPHQGHFLYFSSVRERLVLDTPASTAKGSITKEPVNRQKRFNQSYVNRPELENEIIIKLKDLIEIYEGGILYLHGPAGNGKTTLAKSICKSKEIEDFFEVIEEDFTLPGLSN